MAAGHEGQWSLILSASIQVDSDGYRTVVSVGPRRNILMPAKSLTTLSRLHVKLGMMKRNIRPDEVGSEISDQGVSEEFPENFMLILRVSHSVQAGIFR